MPGCGENILPLLKCVLGAGEQYLVEKVTIFFLNFGVQTYRGEGGGPANFGQYPKFRFFFFWNPSLNHFGGLITFFMKQQHQQGWI